MKKKLFSMFVSSLVFTVCFFWLSHGPHLEGLNQYTALSFASGLMCGIGWGMFLSAWVASELKKNAQQSVRPTRGSVARLNDCEIDPEKLRGKYADE